jgi:ssDNA thymidine ADP-ribosyltransferase, DarT
MTGRPSPTRIYHITHVDNLTSILGDDGLLSDAEMVARGGPQVAVGMSSIKQRRMRLPVKCHQGDTVGEYVPFYFCPRSIMLYLLYMANHPELTYRGGQGPIIHLQADVERTAAWATSSGSRWAFSLANAGAAYAPFRSSLAQLDEVDWSAVGATDFRDSKVKEGKQAEFLVQRFFPWSLVERIGVESPEIQSQTLAALAGAAHQPPVDVLPRWYF